MRLGRAAVLPRPRVDEALGELVEWWADLHDCASGSQAIVLAVPTLSENRRSPLPATARARKRLFLVVPGLFNRDSADWAAAGGGR